MVYCKAVRSAILVTAWLLAPIGDDPFSTLWRSDSEVFKGAGLLTSRPILGTVAYRLAYLRKI